MTAQTLAAAGVFALAAAAVYAYVGARLARRRVSAEARRAAMMFSAWWFALAGTTALTGLQVLAAAAGVTALAPYQAIAHLNLLLVCIALAGLMHYLAYLFTGRDLLVPLAALYGVLYVGLVFILAGAGAQGLEVHRWSVAIDYARPIEGTTRIALVALILVPQLLGALAYFSLYFRMREPTQRYRIALVSWSIIGWFGSALVASSSGLAQADEWQLASRAIGLLAALTILLAYHPPAFVRRRYGIVSITEETGPAGAAAS